MTKSRYPWLSRPPNINKISVISCRSNNQYLKKEQKSHFWTVLLEVATGRIPIIGNIAFARPIYLLNAPCGFVVYRAVEGDFLKC